MAQGSGCVNLKKRVCNFGVTMNPEQANFSKRLLIKPSYRKKTRAAGN